MGKYRDHRAYRHGRNEASFNSPAEPSYFQNSGDKGSAVDAQVTWFNAEKGFGFVKTTDGSEAYLHIRSVEGAGKATVSEGTQLSVRVEKGLKGLQVSQVLEIKGSTGHVGPPEREAGRRPVRAEISEPEVKGAGTVAWYNPDKGFGFIRIEASEIDVFVHASVLNRCGLTLLTQGQKVSVSYAKGHKGLEARNVESESTNN